MSEKLPTIDNYDDLERILDMVWVAGVDPNSRNFAVKRAKAHLEKLMAAARLDELKQIPSAPAGYGYGPVWENHMTSRYAQLTHQASGEESNE